MTSRDPERGCGLLIISAMLLIVILVGAFVLTRLL